jgi:ATP-dependent helicase/nuclease subunit B
VPLTLLAGPANAGKISLLLDRYLAAMPRDPVLIVPNRADVERIERELLRRSGVLLGGFIGTFGDVFARIATGDSERRPIATDTQRFLLVQRAIDGTRLNGLGRSARRRGFAESLLEAIGELESGLLDPEALEGDLSSLYAAYRAVLDETGLWDRDLLRARASRRLAEDLDAWHGEPVFAYGFEDLTAAEWGLLETLAGRAEITASLPYEPGRAAFAALQDTAKSLAALAGGQIEELPPGTAGIVHPALGWLERRLFETDGIALDPPALEGSVRFLEGAGARATLELVADEVLALIRAGTPPEMVAIVCPSLERWRAPVETVFGAFGIPYSLEGRIPLGRTPLGRALGALLRFDWFRGTRHDLYSHLRSPYSGVPRRTVDFAEGRLRGNAILRPDRVEEETERLRGRRLPLLDGLRAHDSPVAAARSLLTEMTDNAYGLDHPAASPEIAFDLRCYDAAIRVLDELDDWQQLSGTVVSREDTAAALERASVRLAAAAEPGRVPVLDLLRARTRQFDAVFVLGLDEGSLPRRGAGTPFLDEEVRRRLGGSLQRPDPVARDRYLFYTACTRASRRLSLVREAATDEGSPRQPSPFWEETRALFDADEVARWTIRRPLSRLTPPLGEASTERERLRALAALSACEPTEARGLAVANGWERRLDRARSAFARPTRLRHPLVLEQLAARAVFNATELERFADCSSAWFVERFLDPRTIDAEIDPKLKGSLVHTALHRFFSGLPRELGTDRVEESRVEEAVGFMRRCLDEALAGVRLEMTDVQRRELHYSLGRDLEALVRAEAESRSPLEPRRFEVAFGTERAAPELQRGLDLGGVTLSGKIDRIDVDPFSARGLVIDYKSGKGAYSAQQIEQELRLQIPLYMLVLRDLVGIEPLGGAYRALGGARRMRGMVRAGEGLEGFVRDDELDEDVFWGRVDSARETARTLAERIRVGHVAHDPRGGGCPSWCDLWSMCRVRRT